DLHSRRSRGGPHGAHIGHQGSLRSGFSAQIPAESTAKQQVKPLQLHRIANREPSRFYAGDVRRSGDFAVIYVRGKGGKDRRVPVEPARAFRGFRQLLEYVAVNGDARVPRSFTLDEYPRPSSAGSTSPITTSEMVSGEKRHRDVSASALSNAELS